MIYLAANHASAWPLRQAGWPMGWMFSPAGARPPFRSGLSPIPFAVDNGLYHDPKQPPKGMKALPAFYSLCRRIVAEGWSPLFVTVPDVPYRGDASRALSAKHARSMRWQFPALRLAVAVQDGMTPDDLDGYDAVFVAGSDSWKDASIEVFVHAAHARGMWAHVARVNGADRMRRCIDAGADSADGTSFGRGDRRQLGGLLRAMGTGLSTQDAIEVIAPQREHLWRAAA